MGMSTCGVFLISCNREHGVLRDKRPGQRLTIAKDGERNRPLPTTRSDDDDE